MYYFIVNPNAKSGRAFQVWNRIEKYLMKHEIPYHAFLTVQPGETTMYADQLTKRRTEPKTIIVVGGDGTFNGVLEGLNISSLVTLGYIPAGTGNDLARSLHIPKSPIKALKRILHSTDYRLLDYGVITYGEEVVHHRRFMVSSGIGLDGSTCHNLAYSLSKPILARLRLEMLSYLIIGLKQYLRARPTKGYLLLDGIKRIEFNNIYFVSAQMVPYEGAGFRFSPHSDNSDGKLEICVVSNASKLEVLHTLRRSFLRKGSNKGIRIYSCTEAKICVERPMATHVDGESCQYQNAIEVRCIKRQIRMLV